MIGHALAEVIYTVAIAGAQQNRLPLTVGQLTEQIQIIQIADATGGQVEDGGTVVHHHRRADRRHAGKLERLLISWRQIRVEIKISVRMSIQILVVSFGEKEQEE